MNKKLYIYNYSSEEGMDFSWIWLNEKDENKREDLIYKDLGGFFDLTLNETKKYYTLDNVWIVPEAMHKDDLKNALERYITKPLLNKTLITFSHGK